MSRATYQPPVSKLLTYGSCHEVDKHISHPKNERTVEELLATVKNGQLDSNKMAELKPTLEPDRWPNYLEELGITSAHIPELIRMAADYELDDFDEASTEIWAPIHAWRCLGFLKAEAAVDTLLGLLKNAFDDWLLEEIPWVLGLIGEGAIAPTAKFLASRGKNEECRIVMTVALEKIAILHPDLKERCIDRLASQLADYSHNSDTVNAFVICSLVELKATDKAHLIERAFANDRVDESILGNWPHAQIAMGMAKTEDFDPEELELGFEWVREMPETFEKPTAPELKLPFESGKRKSSSTASGKDKSPSAKPNKGFGGGQPHNFKQKKSKKRKK